MNLPSTQRPIVGVSVNELAILYYLKPYGFVRGIHGTLSDFGVGNKEIDIFHPKLKIGIEYDGWYFHTKEKDVKKNRLCRKANIHLIRIRESRCDVLNDGMSLNFHLNNDEQLSDDLSICIRNVCGHINQITNLNIDCTKIDCQKDRDHIFSFIHNNYPIDRIGEMSVSTRGQMMQIIKYFNSNHIDVMFEDGTIVKDKKYVSFQNGTIRNPNWYYMQHIGEESVSSYGQKMKIIKYISPINIDVEFEDGVIVKNKKYSHFISGTIRNPQRKVLFQTNAVNSHTVNKNAYLHIGETATSTRGQEMKIVGYHGANHIDVMFEDGTIVEDKRYVHFQLGCIRNPNWQQVYI